MSTQTSNPTNDTWKVAGWIFGGLSFIPLIGIAFGIVAIITGAVKKSKGQIFLGIGGILLTGIMYGSLFYFGFVAKTGVFADLKVKLVQEEMSSLAGQIALYQKQRGQLPESLSDMGSSTPQNPIFLTDPWNDEFSYSIVAGGFKLISLGPDKIANTADDIVQVYSESSTSGTGL